MLTAIYFAMIPVAYLAALYLSMLEGYRLHPCLPALNITSAQDWRLASLVALWHGMVWPAYGLTALTQRTVGTYKWLVAPPYHERLAGIKLDRVVRKAK